MNVSIMDAAYSIEWAESLAEICPEADAVCLAERRAILIARDFGKGWMTAGEREELLEHIVRHEVIHAFLAECGLDSCTAPAEAWAENEEMVDWFAKMLPRISIATSEAMDCLAW